MAGPARIGRRPLASVRAVPVQKNRQRAVQRAKAERLRAAEERRARRKKRLVAAGAVFVSLGMLAAVALSFVGGGGGTDVSTEDTSPTTTGRSSAAGKPCVGVNGPVPPQAPPVPVKEGPPPAQLVTEDLVEGTGAPVQPGATVTVNYVGVACSTGMVFDTSYGGQPATFPLTQVIPGWTQGIPGMKVGGTRLLGIPSEMAYGPSGQGPDIGPDEALWFVVEVLEAKPA